MPYDGQSDETPRTRVVSPPPRPAPRQKTVVKGQKAGPSQNSDVTAKVKAKVNTYPAEQQNEERRFDRTGMYNNVKAGDRSFSSSDVFGQDEEQRPTAAFRARVGSAPEIGSKHRRTRSHFSIPDVVVTSCEEEGEEIHFEVRLEQGKRRVTLPNLPPSQETESFRASSELPSSSSNGSTNGQLSQESVALSRENGKRKQKPPAIRIINADLTEASTGKKNEYSPTMVPLPPSPVPVADHSNRSAQVEGERSPSRGSIKFSQRLRKTSLPNLFSRRERDAAAAAALQDLPPSPTLMEQSRDPSKEAKTSVSHMNTGNAAQSYDNTEYEVTVSPPQTPATPQTPIHAPARPFSPLSLFFGHSTAEKQNGPKSQEQPADGRSGSVTPTLSKKEIKRRQKEEREMIKDLEKVDKMVRKHDKQAEKEKRRVEAKRRKDVNAAGPATIAEANTPRSPLRRLTFFNNTESNTTTHLKTREEVSNASMIPTMHQEKIGSQTYHPKSPRSKAVELDLVDDDVEDPQANVGQEICVTSTPINALPPTLPTHHTALPNSVNIFESLYEQVNAMELTFGEQYPVEAQSRRKSQGGAMLPKAISDKGKVTPPPHFMMDNSADADAGQRSVEQVTNSQAQATHTKRDKAQRESSSTSSACEPDSGSSSDSIASSLSSTVTPITPSLPFEAKSFGAPMSRCTTTSSDEDGIATKQRMLDDDDEGHQISQDNMIQSTGSLDSKTHTKIAPQFTKHGKAIRVGANPNGFRFPPVKAP